MEYVAAGGLLHHQMWPPSWAPFWISPKLKILQEKEEIDFFGGEHKKYDIIKHLAAFNHILNFYS